MFTGGFGEGDCAATDVNSYLKCADRYGISYLGSASDTHDCGALPALICDYRGRPTK